MKITFKNGFLYANNKKAEGFFYIKNDGSSSSNNKYIARLKTPSSNGEIVNVKDSANSKKVIEERLKFNFEKCVKAIISKKLL